MVNPVDKLLEAAKAARVSREAAITGAQQAKEKATQQQQQSQQAGAK